MAESITGASPNWDLEEKAVDLSLEKDSPGMEDVQPLEEVQNIVSSMEVQSKEISHKAQEGMLKSSSSSESTETLTSCELWNPRTYLEGTASSKHKPLLYSPVEPRVQTLKIQLDDGTRETPTEPATQEALPVWDKDPVLVDQEFQEALGEEDMDDLVSGGPGDNSQEEVGKVENVDGALLENGSLNSSNPGSRSQSLGDAPPSGQRKKSISLSSGPKYNSVSYRHIRRGNTKQRIDEFESMMHT